MSRLAVVLLTALVVAVVPSSALAEPPTTLVRTIQDTDGDNRLEHGRGEPHVVREELAPASPTRDRTRVERLFFAQMTDTHVIDEESPLRVEFTDHLAGPFTSAYRAQEGLSAQVLDQMVDQLRNTVSPVTQRRLDLVMTTGDNTDNTQLNETRWMIDTMDGAPVVDPDSGVAGPCGTKGYHGVRGDHRYYEADSSDGEDGQGYSPRESDNGRPSAMRDFPDLFKQMNERFKPVGFDDLPWYAVFGNHDGLVQGNQPRNPALEAYATGCVKITNLPPGTLDAIQAGTAGDGEAAVRALRAALLADPATSGATTTVVPPDARRRPLRKNEWIAQHFQTVGAPRGHGFGLSNLTSGQGNYTFSPAPGLRFVVLDTVAEHGLEEGNLDDEQFRWLDAQLRDAEVQRELVMVFAHHSLRTMGQPPLSPFVPPGDTGGNLNPVVHFGEGPRNTQTKLPCKETYPAPVTSPVPTPPDQLETVRCLLLRHKSVIAFVNGHEHANRATAITPLGDDVPSQNGFWEINTASHIDWGQQSRVIDVVDNRDATLSIFGSIVDHAGPPEPGAAPAPTSGLSAAGDGTQRLAAISRELAFNDPQATHDERGEGGGRGSVADRNVELLIRNPYAEG